MHPWSTFASLIPCLTSGPSARGKDSCHEGRAGLLRGCAGYTQVASAASPSQPHSHLSLSPRSVNSPWPPVEKTRRCQQADMPHHGCQTPGAGLAPQGSAQRENGLGKKGNLFLPTTHSCFRTGTTPAPAQACWKLKEPSLGCSPTLYLPPNTDQNVLSAQGPVPGPGPEARISV